MEAQRKKLELVKSKIRSYPDFPKPGILFRWDIWFILKELCCMPAKKEYLKAKMNDLETNSKNKNIRKLYRGISDFKKGYQPRNNVVKDEKGDLVADTHSILAR
jgi:hypothetical protein